MLSHYKTLGLLISKTDKELTKEGFLNNEVKGFKKIKKVFQTEPSLHDLRQSTMDDCYLIAVLTAIVSRNPSIIKQIITEDDQFVYVNLYQNTNVNSARIYQMDKTKCTNLLEDIFGHNNWGFLIEKAYGIHKMVTEHKIGGFSEVISSGTIQSALRCLLGINTQEFNYESNIKTIFVLQGSTFSDLEKIEKALNDVFLNQSNLIDNFLKYLKKILQNEETAFLFKETVQEFNESKIDGMDFLKRLPNFPRELEPYLNSEVLSEKTKKELAIVCFIKKALEQNELICASTSGKLIIDHLPEDHCYCIYDLYYKNNEYYLKLINPHGTQKDLYKNSFLLNFFNKNNTDINQFNKNYKEINQYTGTFEIKLTDFIKAFDSIITTKKDILDNELIYSENNLVDDNKLEYRKKLLKMIYHRDYEVKEYYHYRLE